MPINSFLYPAKNVPVVYEVDNSLRFDDGDSARLSKTPGDGSRRKFTFSAWIKRGNLTGSNMCIFSPGHKSSSAGNDRLDISFHSTNGLRITQAVGGLHSSLDVRSSQLFRDVSAWYHIVVAIDTEQSTASDRVKMYSNGTQITDFATSTYPSLNADLKANNYSAVAYDFSVGGFTELGFFDGYMAEVVFIDGQQLAADQFGEFDSDSPNIWKPIDVSGLTFGTNGFYLDFEDSSNLGNDANGGTDFDENNIAATDQSTDTCTNNFATWNSLFRKGTTTPAFAEGNLKSTFDDGGANEFALTTFGVSSGKWYAEVKWTSATGTGATATGILDMAYSGTADPNNAVTNAFGYFGNGNKNVSGTASSYGNSYTTGDIIGIAIDMDNNKLYFSKNGTFQNSGDPTSGSTGTGAISIISGVTYGIFTSDYNNKVAELNTGSPAYSISSGNADANGYGNFEYSVPSGYYSLNTKNLAEYG